MLSGALKSLFAVGRTTRAQGNQNFLMLQEELRARRARSAFARQFYNDTVMKFNQKQQSSRQPSSPRFGFQEKEYFEIEEPAAKEPVKVQF